MVQYIYIILLSEKTSRVLFRQMYMCLCVSDNRDDDVKEDDNLAEDEAFPGESCTYTAC